MKSFIAYIAIILFCSVGYGQHMPINTQYMYHGLMINPAIAGSRNDLMTSFSYRNQWMGSEFTPKTFLLSAHSPLKNEKIAIGLQVYGDNAGVFKRNGVSGYAAYRIIGEKSKLSFGMKLGLYTNSTNFSEVDLISPDDPSFKNEESSIKPGFGFGVYYKTDSYYLGTSFSELVNPFEDRIKNNINYNFIAGYNFSVNEKLQILPNVLFRKIGQLNFQPDLTIIFRVNKTLDLGLINRVSKIYGLSIDYLITSQLQIGYSFDIGLGGLNPSNSIGNHEISIAYEFKKVVQTTNTKFF